MQLVRARNITTVGEISSLSEKEVQTLPIKSPKVVNLRKALQAFQQVSLQMDLIHTYTHRVCEGRGEGGGGKDTVELMNSKHI